MPLVDRRTNSVVLRIVYDGPPEAGKATNLQQLCERLPLRRPSRVETPHERAMYLDWLYATGDWVGGARVHCQLVNVPRQLQLSRPGRNILDSADAVVFVADSRASCAPRTKAALRSLVRDLDRRPDVPLVLQANKQDLPGAQPPSDLHQALGLAARVPVIAAHASGGAGVVETFTLAVRVAVDHVRARLVAGEIGGGDATNGNEPLLALEGIPEVFEELDAIASAAEAAATTPALDPATSDDASMFESLAPPLPMAPDSSQAAPERPSVPELIVLTDPIDGPEIGGADPTAPELIVVPDPVATHELIVVPDPIAEPEAPEGRDTATGLDIDLGEWDRTPTETDLPPVSEAHATHDAWPVVDQRHVASTIEEALASVERLERGDAQPTFLPLGTPAPEEAPPLQLPTLDLPAGLVWPGIGGRSALAQLTPPIRAAATPVSWAPATAVELVCGDGWIAHTAASLWFADLADAREALLDATRWQVALGKLTPPGRTYAVSPHGDGAWLWIITPGARTAWDAIEDAFRRGDRALAGQLARRGLEIVDAIRALGVPIGDLDHVAIDDPPHLLATPWTPRSDRLTAQLQRLFAEAVL